jgi:hypothetical protein
MSRPTHRQFRTAAHQSSNRRASILERCDSRGSPTLRLHYREIIDNATEVVCSSVFVNLVEAPDPKMATETYLLTSGHYQIEVMANLDKVSAK